MAQSDKTKAITKAIRQYKKAIKALKEVQGGYIDSINVGGSIDDLNSDIHELEQELEDSKEEDKEN